MPSPQTHPLFKEENITSLGKEKTSYRYDIFAQKFLPSLLKLFELKGIYLKKKEHRHRLEYRPQLQSTFSDILVLKIKTKREKLREERGFLYFETHLISKIIHKTMGGANHLPPTPIRLPLKKIEEMALRTCFGIFSTSLREGLKHTFKGREGQELFLEIEGPLGEVEFLEHLQKQGKSFLEEFSFEEGMCLSVLLNNF